MDARLMREHVQADARLCGLDWDPGHALQVSRQVAQLLVFELWDLDAEQVTQLQEHLMHRRVAGALANAVDARREHLGARSERHHGVPSAETKVVVKVHHQRRVRRRGFDARDVFAHRERRVAAHGVGGRRPRAARPQSFAMDLRDVLDVGAAAVLAAELDRRGALLTRVADRVAHHPQVGGAIKPHRKLEPFRFGNAFAMEQRLAELVLHVQVGRRREDEVRDLVPLVAERVDHPHGGIDVAGGRTHHADDLEVRADLSTFAAFEDQPHRLALPLRDRWKADIHHVDADV